MTTKKFLDYEGLGKFWNLINTKFTGLFATKTDLSDSKVVAVNIGGIVDEKNPNSPLLPTVDVILGTTVTNQVNYSKFSAELPIVSEKSFGIMTPDMFNRLNSTITDVRELPIVSEETNGLMTPELLDKVKKSIQNKLLNDSSISTEDGNTYLNLTFEYSDGSEATEKINVSDLVDTYIKGEGISIDNNVISIDNDWINDNINVNIETISESEIESIVNPTTVTE